MSDSRKQIDIAEFDKRIQLVKDKKKSECQPLFYTNCWCTWTSHGMTPICAPKIKPLTPDCIELKSQLNDMERYRNEFVKSVRK